MNPYISIICPCYNGETFIECAITSVLSQPVECVEMIVVDDGSTDDTPFICQKYASDRIKYYRTENFGTGHARNFGLEQAQGTWIMYLDADDLYLNNSINDVFIDTLHEYEKQKVDIVYTPCFYVDYYLKQWIKKDDAEEHISVIPQFTFWNGIYSHNFLVNNRIRFYEYKEQDIESAFRYLAYDSAKKTVANNEMKFYLQRENYSSNTHTWDLKKVCEIKTFVYYDLLKNHAHSVENRNRLLSELLSIIKTYFIEVKNYGYNNQEKFSHVCMIARECLLTSKARKFLGGKQYIKELIRYFLCTLFAKKQELEIKGNKEDQKNDISLDEVMNRLKTVSRFLLAD
ncbi:MAG: glycosyltransferase family 2 protein [Aeriscardovia sp.]|nr:glycosyltransferase family 2 protein [Aeriscardovia sp.]